ncbi:hydroxypyruvate isomerase [Janthinobacterium sp. SUN128]|uniref:2-oxo-tetronate isomerase n=1 Tax=Janthinobacterium sp. SUN128 TaxID=3014790 RepID=UPI002712312C|nr:2-oxo-tetronate isomerase [Janthinobacterium sp. SUN128]MDO8032053.1 hydroxypyruvate isomerase [Janthinobacterium sp. SUN128]
MPNFAANLSMMFTELPFLDRFAAAREAGFDAVEFLFPYAVETRQIAMRLERHQLQLAVFNFPPGDWEHGERGIACDPRRGEEFRGNVQLALNYALALGAKQLHCMAGIVPPGMSLERARQSLIGNLQFAADACRPHGINVLIEPINRYDMPGYFLNHSQQAADIIADCQRSNIFLQYDVYHMQRMEGELSNTIRAMLPLIRHIQIADTPGRHEPGTGEINYRHVFKLLDQIGYAGWVGCEYRPASDTVTGLGWREQLTGTAGTLGA